MSLFASHEALWTQPLFWEPWELILLCDSIACPHFVSAVVMKSPTRSLGQSLILAHSSRAICSTMLGKARSQNQEALLPYCIGGGEAECGTRSGVEL